MTVPETLQTIPLGTYLFQRLQQVNNLSSIFGVPGDFNLKLLEHMYVFPNLRWVGTCNELNAGYAADGYARINRFGCLITTFGVGELSALNAISGAFAEDVPVLHIVGTSSTNQKHDGDTNVHHLVPGKQTWKVCQDHYVYEKLVEPFTCCHESLDDEDLDSIQSKIDRVIETIYKESKPGYLFIPSNLADIEIPIKNTRLSLDKTDGNPEITADIAGAIIEKLQSKKFAILADSLIKNRSSELNNFVETNNIHGFATVMAKSILNEQYHNYHGILNGPLSTKGTLESATQFECILHLGVYFNEINNQAKHKVSDYVKDVIEVGKDYVLIDGKLHTGIDIELVFDAIVDKYTSNGKPPYAESNSPNFNYSGTSSSILSQATLAQSLQDYIRPNDVIVCEMCSFLFQVPDLKFPKGVKLVSQSFYGSIGYALPATLGVSVALRDAGSGSRVLLIQGDGSAQMTVQELSSYLRYDINPTILLLNNEGYSVERIICGPTRSYNDIQPNWNWTGLFSVFGDVDRKSRSIKVDDLKSLQEELAGSDSCLRLIEIVLEKMDVPWRFSYTCGAAK